MPNIPDVEPSKKNGGIGSKESALAVARVLAGRSQRNDGIRFMPVVKEFFRQNPEAKEQFVEWYSEVPGEEDDEAPRSRKKKKRKSSEDDED